MKERNKLRYKWELPPQENCEQHRRKSQSLFASQSLSSAPGKIWTQCTYFGAQLRLRFLSYIYRFNIVEIITLWLPFVECKHSRWCQRSALFHQDSQEGPPLKLSLFNDFPYNFHFSKTSPKITPKLSLLNLLSTEIAERASHTLSLILWSSSLDILKKRKPLSLRQNTTCDLQDCFIFELCGNKNIYFSPRIPPPTFTQ